MTTFMYTTTSTESEITNTFKVQSLLDNYYFTVEPTLYNNRISFMADSKPNSAFDVYASPDQRNSVVEEFLEKLSEYLKEDFEVKCIEVEGDGDPDAWKWTVTKNGTVTSVNL